MSSDISEPPFPKIEIFPNPFSNQLIFTNLPSAFAEISIFDLTRKLIFKTEKPPGQSEIAIFTEEFQKGIFFVFIKTENNLFQKKTIKI